MKFSRRTVALREAAQQPLVEIFAFAFALLSPLESRTACSALEIGVLPAVPPMRLGKVEEFTISIHFFLL